MARTATDLLGSKAISGVITVDEATKTLSSANSLSQFTSGGLDQAKNLGKFSTAFKILGPALSAVSIGLEIKCLYEFYPFFSLIFRKFHLNYFIMRSLTFFRSLLKTGAELDENVTMTK